MSIRQFQTGKPSEARWPFSPAVRVDGDLLYTSGMVGRDGAGKPPAPNDMAAQAGLAAQSVLDALEAGGSDAQNIVKLTTYVTDIEAYGAARAATDVLFQAKPASTLIEIGRLAAPDMLVEIEAVAHVPGTSSAVTPAKEPFGTGKPWEARAAHAPGNKTGVPLVFTAGFTGRRPDGSINGPDDMAAQAGQAVSNLTEALRVAGSSPERIVKLVLFATDVDRFMAEGMPLCRGLYDAGPSSTLIGVTRLAHPDLMFEIEAVAECGEQA